MSQTSKSIAVISGIVVSLAVLVVVATLAWNGDASESQFDRQIWEKSTRRGICDFFQGESQRMRLARGLVSRSQLIGLDRRSVVDLLGEPSRELAFPDSERDRSFRLCWSLGGHPRRGGPQDPLDTLYVDLDDQGVAARAWIAAFANP